MANKFDGDVRPLSNDPRYMGVVFSGSIDEAITQAMVAKDFGMPEQPGNEGVVSRDRWNLLEHLNLTSNVRFGAPDDSEDWSVQYGPIFEDRNYQVKADSRVISKYSLEYALSMGWVTRVQS